MGTPHNVLHTGARPIRLSEFLDALRATCTPRFPHARGTHHRRAVLAISGGVDSMALAYLCSRVRRQDPDFKISDNPVSGFISLIIDHKLRKGSSEEALAVSLALKDMGILTEVAELNWPKAIGPGNDPNDLTNVESMARTLRYQRFGNMCAYRNMASILLAHHEDDQYETVLMRLLQGHGTRGLRGMKKAHDIPECDGMHGASKSGYVDDQRREYPFYNTRPSYRERKHMKQALRQDVSELMNQADLDEDPVTGLADVDVEEFYFPKGYMPSAPAPLEIEDGGVTIYRPLLEFSKDRLIATCLANNIPWWEDETNKDPTLTMRNAVRHLYKGYALPTAIQKPAILALSKRCVRKVEAQEAEANRLLRQAIIHDFEPNAGTATVQFPNIRLPSVGRGRHSSLRRQAVLSKQKEIAAILVRKVFSLVSPELQPPLVSTLESHVFRLFPSLASSEEAAAANPPKPFTLSGVFLVPIVPSSGKTADQPLTWYLSRAPYPSTAPLPRSRMPYWATKDNRREQWQMSTKTPFMLWDGRYWVHIEHRLPYRLIVLPFLREHAKVYRESLTPEGRNRLATFLKRYAPGKVRYTLPAIYLEEDLDLNNPIPRPNYPNPELGSQDLHPKVPNTSKMRLVALPSMDSQVPGLDEWVTFEIRYKRVDRDVLQTAGSFDRGPFVSLRELGRQRVLVRRPVSRQRRE
ncbi:adenine nucleotide alpha hydrolases-like protein [Hypoxylon trugodes]|uniref:adenine nucleotide alpha hydrolases-like protein n=1 Tax=Hypoxylon trugodes TaxID=326681 RepID=UPI00218C953F|nr:adenine nucleotide alpha hydrolases-like protein [Hypoxylon trugodes]KAI1388427.1 adenine nucleotide alpha hydrolases-like protein [Hypoxylon trugodes]